MCIGHEGIRFPVLPFAMLLTNFVPYLVLQMMVLLSGALRNSPTGGKLQALEGWLLLLKALAQHAPSHLGGMANQVISLLQSSPLSQFTITILNRNSPLWHCRAEPTPILPYTLSSICNTCYPACAVFACNILSTLHGHGWLGHVALPCLLQTAPEIAGAMLHHMCYHVISYYSLGVVAECDSSDVLASMYRINISISLCSPSMNTGG